MAMDAGLSLAAAAAAAAARARQPKKAGLLKSQLELVKRNDCDRYEIARLPEPLSFEKGFYMFIQAMQKLARVNEGINLVGIAGPSGAGKTVFCEKILSFMPGILAISMDNYNDSTRLIDDNFDDPRLTDYDTLLQNIQDLKAGKPVEIPIYDFKLSCRTGTRKVDVPSSRIVIIEGIYALSEKLRPVLDLRVSITGGVHFDLVKRVLRDINRSGQAPSDIIHQVSETVYPMYKVFIEPDLETAHIRVVNKFNPFSGFQNPFYILKSTRVPSEDQIREVLSTCDPGKTEETYDIYLLPPGEDPETCQSYLRMRNRDGKYSLMFEETVIDNPFIISPRITFEVNVRLLGGLMTLGYQITLSLKRTSHVYTDDKVTVKVDQLEQLHRKYIQVQGKERSLVAEVAKKLGLDGSYIANSYIEQIQLEKLINEVMQLPDELKTKLPVSPSPLPSLSWISEAKPGLKNQYSKSWSRNSTNHGSVKDSLRSTLICDNGSNKKYDSMPYWTRESTDEDYVQLKDQMTGISERLDQVLSHISDLENKFPHIGSDGHVAGSLGNSLCAVNCNGNLNGFGSSPPRVISNGLGLGLDASIVEEVKNLGRGQRHLTKQLDVLSNILRENVTHAKQHNKNSRWSWNKFFRSVRTTDTGLAIATVVTVTVGIGGVIGMIVLRKWRTQ